MDVMCTTYMDRAKQSEDSQASSTFNVHSFFLLDSCGRNASTEVKMNVCTKKVVQVNKEIIA